MDLDAILLSLLLEPDTCRAESLAGLASELRCRQGDRRSKARSLLAAVALQRPDLASPELVSTFLDGMSADERDPAPVELLEALLAHPELVRGLDAGSILVDSPCRPEVRLQLARAWAGWRPKEIEIGDLVALAQRLPSARLAPTLPGRGPRALELEGKGRGRANR